jgi:hypothetical protein
MGIVNKTSGADFLLFSALMTWNVGSKSTLSESGCD